MRFSAKYTKGFATMFSRAKMDKNERAFARAAYAPTSVYARCVREH